MIQDLTYYASPYFLFDMLDLILKFVALFIETGLSAF